MILNDFSTINANYGLGDMYITRTPNLPSKIHTSSMYGIFGRPPFPEIKKVIFNDPATIVIWDDYTKTIVKCGEGEPFDPEKGLAMAIAKKALGNQGNYYETFKKWLPEEDKYILSKPIEESDDGITVRGTLTDKAAKLILRSPHTIKEYCEKHNITKNKVYRMIKAGGLMAEKESSGVWIIYE